MTTTQIIALMLLVPGLALSVLACENSGNFKGLEEKKAFEKEKQIEAAATLGLLPVLTKVQAIEALTGSVVRFDLQNERDGTDEGMSYGCTFDRKLDGNVEAGEDCAGLPGDPATRFDAATGKLEWTPSDAAAGGFELRLEGRNAAGSDFGLVAAQIRPDRRPKLTKLLDKTVKAGETLRIDVDDERRGGDEGVTYRCAFDRKADGSITNGQSCKTLPGAPEIKFDSQAGVLVWQPGTSEIGVYELEIAGESPDGTGQEVFVVTVAAADAKTLALTHQRDLFVTPGDTVTVDVRDEVTGSDEGILYECFVDMRVDGNVDHLVPCDNLPGPSAQKFDALTGKLTWVTSAGSTGDVEIEISGKRGDASDATLFVVSFAAGGFGEIGNAALEFSPPSWDFGNLRVGRTSAVKNIVVKNAASRPVYLGTPTAASPHFVIDYTSCPKAPEAFAAGATCAVGVSFKPSSAASLGTLLSVPFGKSAGNAAEFSASAGLSGQGIGEIDFAGLQTISDLTHNSLSLNWPATPTAVSFIVFQIRSGELVYVETLLNTGGTVTGKTYRGLQPSTAYTYRVRATDVLGTVDSNTRDVTATTLANRPPDLAPFSPPATYAGRAFDTTDFNDRHTGSDVDRDGDVVTYTCRYDEVADGTVAATANECASLPTEAGTVAFNRFTGVFSGWMPRFADTGKTFEISVRAVDPYDGTSTTVFSATILTGVPALSAPANAIFPSSEVVAGDVYALDFDNERFSPPSDDNLTYACTFRAKSSAGLGAATGCTSLPGASASFDTATGELSWTTSQASVGGYRIDVTGTNGAGANTRQVHVAVRPAYDRSAVLAEYLARFADLKGPGSNAPSYLGTLADASIGAADLSLTGFATTSAWSGNGAAASPFALSFDGVDDYASGATDLGSRSSIAFDAWVQPLGTGEGKAVFSYGDANGHGLTLTNEILVQGDGTNPYSAAVLADSPLAYYRFNSPTLGIGYDWSGNNRHGTPVASATLLDDSGVPEAGGQAFSARGNGYLSVSIPGNNTWTVETWFQFPFPNGCSNGVSWCTLARGSNDHPAIVNSSLVLGVYDNATGTGFRSSGYNMSGLASGWHHLAAVASGGTTTFYIDGAAVGTSPFAPQGNIVGIGNHTGGGQAAGYLDEFAVYGTALSAARIQAHYDAARSRVGCRLKLASGYWVHVAGVVDSVGQSMRVFIDGRETCAASLAGAPTLSGSTGALQIGRRPTGEGFWQGQLAELRFHSTLTPAKIVALEAAGARWYATRAPLPVMGGLRLLVSGDSGLYQDAAATTAAGATNDPVGYWQDLSGNGGHLTQGASGKRPVLRKGVLNGHDVVGFDGVDDLILNTINYTFPYTVTGVARVVGAPAGRVISSVNNNWLLGWYGGGREAYYAEGWVKSAGPAAVYGAWQLYTGDYSGNLRRLFSSSAYSGGSSSAGAAGPNGLALGGSGVYGELSNCEVATVAVFGRVLSDLERAAVEGKLKAAFNLP